MKNFFTYVFFLLLFTALPLFPQIRVTVIPFSNMNGNMQYNKYCFTLQDSIQKVLSERLANSTKYVVVPYDSVEAILTGLNLDPTNPQYLSDMWKAVKTLNIQKVISGDFNFEANKFLINSMIINVRTRLADPNYQVHDLFLPEAKIFDSVKMILDGLIEGFQ